MKTSEMIAMLENNPKLKFMSDSNNEVTACLSKDNAYVIAPYKDKDYMQRIIKVNDTWTLIEELKEVTFLEAINQNKPISNKRGTTRRCSPSWILKQGITDIRDINDKWFIIESEESK